MALFPCAVGSHRYAGQQNSAYLGLVNGSEVARSKMRLCGKHVVELGTWLDEHMKLVAIGDVSQEDEPDTTSGCQTCGASEPAWNAFANLYLRGAEPRVYFAALCEGHVATFCERAQIAL